MAEAAATALHAACTSSLIIDEDAIGAPVDRALVNELLLISPPLSPASLSVVNSKVTDAALGALLSAVGPSLTELCVSNCSELTADIVEVITARAPKLISLDLSHTYIENRSLAALAPLRSTLTKLSVEHCLAIDNDGVAAIAEHCPLLTELNVRECFEIRAAGITAAAGLAELEVFRAGGCFHLMGGYFAPFATLPKLRVLDLERCKQMMDFALAPLAAIPALEELTITDAPMLTDDAADTFATFPALKVLDLRGCDFSDEAAAALPNVRIILNDDE